MSAFKLYPIPPILFVAYRDHEQLSARTLDVLTQATTTFCDYHSALRGKASPGSQYRCARSPPAAFAQTPITNSPNDESIPTR
jgi:hypothetical protein